MFKRVLGVAAAAAAFASGPAGASVIVNAGTIALDGLPTVSYVSQVNGTCTSPCSFNNAGTFVTPTGFNSVNATYNSTASTTNGVVDQSTNLDFVTGVFNNSLQDFTFTIGANGIVENGSALFIPLIAGAINTITFTGAANGGAAGTVNANIQGGLSFSQGTPAVPEPSTWAMMLVGFGLAGYSLRSRKRVALLAA